MTTTIHNPLSDMNQIKDSLIAMFGESGDITRLVLPMAAASGTAPPDNWYGSHCFDTSYIEGSITENSCAIYIDTILAAASNPYVKEVTVQISVICHRGAVALSEEDKTAPEPGYYGKTLAYTYHTACRVGTAGKG